MIPFYEGEEVTDPIAYRMNRNLHPALIMLFEETQKALVRYKPGLEDYRADVLTRFDEIKTDMYRVMNSLVVQNKLADGTLKELADKHPGLFHGQDGLYRDIKDKHGVE